ncbi:DUF5703 family protein [Nocardioides marmorisolisilvae]|uniref:DUF5703 family protein n=1 Tax=Nocardioides marmorisolisilvae TaxID=1542737 RepID=UPI0026CE9FCD
MSTAQQSPRPKAQRRALRPGVEYEYDQVFIHRDESRNFVTRLLVQRAESGGWEVDRLRIGPDGNRRVTLRRKIIRQTQLYFSWA